MSCGSCGKTKEGSDPTGCNSNGGCSTGSCNRLNTFDWLARTEIEDQNNHGIIEVSFKNGVRKDFYAVPRQSMVLNSGDMVVVDTGSGSDVGRVNLTGALVRLQMKKKKVSEDRLFKSVRRIAGHRDLERLQESRAREKETMIRARAITRSLGLDMKISDVTFQADGRKATFYFIANGRVDFRELIRSFAREFRIKIEMRQIGSRQESSLVGGIGSCGRELCCSTWLTNFKNVSTRVARYQNLSINQSKLSGQCGRLKCCLNYELDLYLEAVRSFPLKAEKLRTIEGTAYFIKVDIFKKLMFYSLKTEMGRSRLLALDIAAVKKIKAINKAGDLPESFNNFIVTTELEDDGMDFDADLTGSIVLKEEKKRHTGRRKGKGRGGKKGNQKSRGRKRNPDK